MRKSAFRLVLESAESRAARSAVTLADARASLAASEGEAAFGAVADVGSEDCACMLGRDVGGLVIEAALGLVSIAGERGRGRLVWAALAEFCRSRLRGA